MEGKKGAPVIMPDRCGLREDKQHDWVIDLPMAVSLEQAMDPAFYSHVAEQMEAGDHITLRPEDFSWIAYLVVTASGRNYAKVHLIQKEEFDSNQEIPTQSQQHRIEWKGPHLRYCVIRIDDAKLLNSGSKKKSEAYAWLQEYERTMR